MKSNLIVPFEIFKLLCEESAVIVGARTHKNEEVRAELEEFVLWTQKRVNKHACNVNNFNSKQNIVTRVEWRAFLWAFDALLITLFVLTAV